MMIKIMMKAMKIFMNLSKTAKALNIAKSMQAELFEQLKKYDEPGLKKGTIL